MVEGLRGENGENLYVDNFFKILGWKGESVRIFVEGYKINRGFILFIYLFDERSLGMFKCGGRKKYRE